MEKSSFFNSEIINGEYDRVYLAEDYANYFSSFIGNGIFPNPSDGLQITTDGESMTVQVNAGKAWINGYYYENDSNLILNIEPADGVLDRIDRVVLRLDLVEREISVKIKKGDFSSNPVAKSIERNVDVYELALADIRINHGIISVSKSMITDLRLNKELCGIVHGVVEQVDTTEIFNTYQHYLNERINSNEFNEWFMGLKNKLDPYQDLAFQLQIQIDGLETKVSTIEASVGENLNEQLQSKADKNGELQENLNADMFDGKHSSDFASNIHNHQVITGSNSSKVNMNTGNDCSGLSKSNNVDISSWYGVSFSNTCSGAGVQGRPSASLDVRTGTLYLENDVVINGQSLFQNVSNGKSSIANAIAGKGINANSSMTFAQLVAAINSITVQKEIHKQAHWMEVTSMYLPNYSIGYGNSGDESNWQQDGNKLWFFRNGYYNEYDIANKKWIANKSYSGGCAKAGNFIYGLTGGTYPKFNTYNLSDGTSTSVECRYASYKSTGTRVATNTGIHVLGGATGTSVANKVLAHQKIIFGTGAIASRSSLPEKNSGPRACSDENCNVYCIGGSGYDGNNTYAVNKFGRFNEVTNTWTYFSTDKGVAFDCMTCRNNIVYLFNEDTITIYNIATGTWSVKSTKKGIKAWGATMFMCNGILHLSGGEYGLVDKEATSQVTWAFVE